MPEIKPQVIAPRLVHNRALMDKFLAARGIKAQWPAVEQQLESVVVGGLDAGAYNPSIAQYRGRLVMAYRFHDTTLKTKIGIAELSENLIVTGKQTLDVGEEADKSIEDGKLFVLKNDLWLNFVVSTWPEFPSSQVKNLMLTKPDHWRTSDKDMYWVSARKTMEKNHVPFVHEEVLHIIWHQAMPEDGEPKQVIYTPADKREMKTPALRWPYGQFKGGTIPILWNGKLLSFFHSRLDNEMPIKFGKGWRYYVGAVLRRAIPPFDMLAISKRPILRGSEVGGDESRFHFKPNVVFPLGAIEHGGGWLVSVGVNDSQCLLVKITEKDLQL